MTMTYETEPKSFNGHGTLKKKHLQDFWKRLRKKALNYSEFKIKYYAVGEYGTSSLRPHYHAIVYNCPMALIQNSQYIAQKIWQHGHVHIAECNMATITYTAKYIMHGRWTATQDDDDRQPEFATQSKNLGETYLTPQMVNYHIGNLVNVVTLPGNKLIQLPRYYKDKIFSKYEKAKMARESKKLHNMNWQEFINHDFHMEITIKKDGIRKHEKQLKYAKLKL